MNNLIPRIKARIADPKRVTDMAIWGCVTAAEAGRPFPKLPAPASEAEVDAAEAALGFRIPPFLRTLYLEVANGEFGPAWGILGVPTVPPSPDSEDIVSLYALHLDYDPSYGPWPHGLLPLMECGCSIREYVDCMHPPHAVFLDDPNSAPLARPEAYPRVADSLEQRFEQWLEDELKRQKSPIEQRYEEWLENESQRRSSG